MTIDVQIQNRIVSIAVYSHFPEPADLKGQWFEKLDSALGEMQYSLSGVIWKNSTVQTTRGIPHQGSFHTGKVDIRI
ncbi:hypothetical protein HCN83_02070 [Bacillus luteus]|uniref:Uncharacterized protein n=2 Tax=Alkalicoccus luteus TaxID=1237094 RepID=A0A969TTK5_9BACI|nr:hypothetical protein [Alkalicoccus luteus]